jgi:hypothetical protein
MSDHDRYPVGARAFATALVALLVVPVALARDTAFGGVRFTVPAGYERSQHQEVDNAMFVLETVARTQCTFAVTSGSAPTDTLLREFAAVWAAAIDDVGTVPEPRRGTAKGGARYMVADGRMRIQESTRGRWLQAATIDFDDRQRHAVFMIAHSDADIPRCRKDVGALLDSLRADPGWVPPPQAIADAANDEASVEDLTMLNGKATDVELLWCESKKKQRQSCPADTSGGVIFVGRASFADCEDGKSYQAENGAIVVDKGCRGRFAVRAPASASARGQRFTCESHLNDSIYCEYDRIERGVRIARVLSRARCVWNDSWGVVLDDLGINTYVWVAKGCRAEFQRW